MSDNESSSVQAVDPIINPQTALVYVMVVTAVADGELDEVEVKTIADSVDMLPAFTGLGAEATQSAIGACSDLLQQDDGLDTVLALIEEALPDHLCETAYALACDVTAADGKATQEELRWLEMLRDHLDVSRLHAAAIEWGTRVRFARV